MTKRVTKRRMMTKSKYWRRLRRKEKEVEEKRVKREKLRIKVNLTKKSLQHNPK